MSQLFAWGDQSTGVSALASYTHKQNQNNPTKLKYNTLTQQTKETKNYIYLLRKKKKTKAQTWKQN